MPTYTYECKKCGHTQDVFHGMSETRRVKCEDCGGACRKLLGTGAGLIFKGSGFYETDYKRSGNGKGGKTGEPSKSDGGKSEGGKSESGSSEGSSKSEPAKSDSGKSSSKSETKGSGSSTKSSGDK